MNLYVILDNLFNSLIELWIETTWVC